MFFRMLTKELGMTIIGRKYCSIKMKWVRKILNSIVLGLIFGPILLSILMMGSKMIRKGSMLSIVMSLKKLRPKKLKLIIIEKILKRNLENMRVLVIQILRKKKCWSFIKIGKTLRLIRLLFGVRNGILVRLVIDGSEEKWKNKIRNRGKVRKKPI